MNEICFAEIRNLKVKHLIDQSRKSKISRDHELVNEIKPRKGKFQRKAWFENTAIDWKLRGSFGSPGCHILNVQYALPMIYCSPEDTKPTPKLVGETQIEWQQSIT